MSLNEIKEDITKYLRDEGIAVLEIPPTVQISVLEERLIKVLYPDCDEKKEEPTSETQKLSDHYEA